MFSDVVGALGWVHDAVVGCAYPELVGREVVSVQSTRELERFPLDRGLLGMGMLRTVDESLWLTFLGDDYECSNHYY